MKLYVRYSERMLVHLIFKLALDSTVGRAPNSGTVEPGSIPRWIKPNTLQEGDVSLQGKHNDCLAHSS